MAASPRQFYEDLSKVKENEGLIIKSRLRLFGWIRILNGLLILAAAVLLFREGLPGSGWTLLALIALFLILVRFHSRWEEKGEKNDFYLHFIRQELKALEGDFSAFRTGSDYIDALHPYSLDLDLFGSRSIYQLICRTTTEDGAHQLALLLSCPYASPSEYLRRQEIISVLSLLPEFLIEYRVAGAGFAEQAGDTGRIKEWLQKKDAFRSKAWMRLYVLIIPPITVLLAVLYFMGLVPGVWFILVAVVNWIILGSMSKAIKELSLYVGRSAKLLGKYEALLERLKLQEFQTVKWQRQAANAYNGIIQFRKLVQLFEARFNPLVGPLVNTFFLFDIYCAIRLENWRKRFKAAVEEGLDVVAEVDLYVSLAQYAFDRPLYRYPTFSDTTAYEAENIRHPLLRDQAIGNDMSLGNRQQFYLLTGANMTGKSTFIRTLGVNLILGYCGLPVASDRVSLPVLKLYTAMRITDSVQDDVSYFRAELNRISGMMNAAATDDHPFMVLLDEPLRGTNTTDKQQGTKAIIEKLLCLKAIGIVATHDTVLCGLEEDYPQKISNFHFESRLIQNELVFDYKLKRGGSTSNNATILMQQLGIINS